MKFTLIENNKSNAKQKSQKSATTSSLPSCPHLGRRLPEVECKPCQGKQGVYECEIWGSCTAAPSRHSLSSEDALIPLNIARGGSMMSCDHCPVLARPVMLGVSLVVLLNDGDDLDSCLESIQLQVVLPSEVVLVDCDGKHHAEIERWLSKPRNLTARDTKEMQYRSAGWNGNRQHIVDQCGDTVFVVFMEGSETLAPEYLSHTVQAVDQYKQKHIRRTTVVPANQVAVKRSTGPRPEWLNRSRVAKPTDRELNVGVMQQAVNVGGAEIWAETMCRYSRHKWTFWSDRIQVDPKAVEQLGAATIFSTNWKEWRDTQDVIIVWCHTADMVMPRLKDWGGEIILLSQGSGEWTARFMHSMTPYADRLFAVSEYSAKTTYKPEDVSRVNIVLNSADPTRIVTNKTKGELRNELGLGESLAVSYIGRWSHEKNPTAVAKAAMLLPDAVAVYKCPDYKLAEKELVKIPKDRLRLTQLTPAEALKVSDVTVLASPGEGCSLLVMEALAAGTPVVATPVGGIIEMEREHGQLVVRIPINPSPEILAKAINEAHRIRDQLIPAGLAFTEKWNAHTMAERWDSFLENKS